ncbi:hypothetical protein E2C01_000680 [Portunus trituberculatus]|uniref:Uncharacterized protein n=1 Tax=Portunus trituberculatus TaxID=210409 RepID=A0A5B7CFP5_PORTR|nr:hypothetical protein [Portunus trituberculatus]
MRTMIRDTPSSTVTSHIPQCSVLAPVMFKVYIKDIQEALSSYINLFAGNARLLRIIRNIGNCMELQKDIEKI